MLNASYTIPIALLQSYIIIMNKQYEKILKKWFTTY